MHIFPPDEYSSAPPQNRSVEAEEGTVAPCAGEIKVARDRDLIAGDELTFFYPSTEWAFDRSFACGCQVSECIGTLRGARAMEPEVLERYFVNRHIWELLETSKESE